MKALLVDGTVGDVEIFWPEISILSALLPIVPRKTLEEGCKCRDACAYYVHALFGTTPQEEFDDIP